MATKAKKSTEKKTKEEIIQIKEPRFKEITIPIVGIAPLVINRFSKRSMESIIENQTEDEAEKSTKKRFRRTLMYFMRNVNILPMKDGMGSKP